MRPAGGLSSSEAVRNTLYRCIQISGMKGSIKSLDGHHHVVQVHVPRVLWAHVVLRDLNIERVFARGFDEDDATEGFCSFF